jgi:uncharacterized phage protein (TIGR02218 family)
MKTATVAMTAHLNLSCTTLAFLWKVKRKDGTLLGFTNHDLDLVYNDGTDTVTYQGETGMTPSATETNSGLATDNLEVTAFLDSDSITDDDIRAGLYNYADIEVRVVNWADLTMGDIKIRKGTLGIVKMQNGVFVSEIRGLSFRFGTVLGQLYGPTCRVDLGSTECGVNLVALQETGTVAVATDSRAFTATGLAHGSGYYTEGVLTWLTGANAGLTMDVGSWDGTTIVLFESMPFVIAPGDTFTAEPGCNHFATDCQDKFTNIANFRAEKDIPGQDSVLSYPSMTG